MAKKFVEVTGLHNVFDVSSTGSSLNTDTLKESVSAKANYNSILFITAKDDSAYGYPDGDKYIWTRGKLYNCNNTSEGHIYDSTKDSLVEGVNPDYSINQATGIRSHAEGESTTASGFTSHAEGSSTTASGYYSHAEGKSTTASGDFSHAEGSGSSVQLSGISSRTATTITFSALPSNIKIGSIIQDVNNVYVSVDDINTSTKTITVNSNLSTTGNLYLVRGIARGSYSHAEGQNTIASGDFSHAEGSSTTASGNQSHAEGNSTTASGDFSHAEGVSTTASGNQSHAEGNSTTASGYYSHAEGVSTTASGNQSHAEGGSTTASRYTSHAEGYNTTAAESYSHAEGFSTIASGYTSHAEGSSTTASGNFSHAEGAHTYARGSNSHAEGVSTRIFGSGEDSLNVRELTTSERDTIYGLTGKWYTYLDSNDCIPDGCFNIDLYDNEQSETQVSIITDSMYISIDGIIDGDIFNTSTPIAEGEYWIRYDFNDESRVVEASGPASHAEGIDTHALGIGTHAEGNSTTASGDYSHAEGEGVSSELNNVQSGTCTIEKIVDSDELSYIQSRNLPYTHIVKGNELPNGLSSIKLYSDDTYTTEVATIKVSRYDSTLGGDAIAFVGAAPANGTYYYKNYSGAYGAAAHSEGSGSVGLGLVSHAEGFRTTASGDYSHAEGTSTTASGDYSHAEGVQTVASGWSSHAEGGSTVASGSSSHAEGSGSVGLGLVSHAEGTSTTASGSSSHAEGGSTVASGSSSHAEGTSTTASGDYSHAEGSITVASGMSSHAEGSITVASGWSSHAEGHQTKAIGDCQHVQGKFSTFDSNKAFIIGGGTADNDRINIMTVDWSGNVIITGSLSQSSDVRLKDVKSELDLQKCYDLLNSCSTVVFNWKDDEEHRDHIGVIAQEVKEFFPEIVSENSEGYLTVDYSKLAVICMRVMKDLIDRVSKLEKNS